MKTENYFINNRLHTEVLEEAYGKITVQILHDDNNIREVLLTDRQDIARTYAVTIKNTEWLSDEDVCHANNAVLAGETIGAAFKKRGFDIRKNVIAVFIMPIPGWLLS